MVDPGPADVAGPRMDDTNLLQIDTVPANTPSQDLLRFIREHEENGIPLVITGTDCDSHWRSQPSPTVWDNVPVDSGAGTVQNCVHNAQPSRNLTPRPPTTVDPSRENDASTILSWLEMLLLIPRCLLSRAEDAEFPKVIKDLKHEHDGQGTSLRCSRRRIR